MAEKEVKYDVDGYDAITEAVTVLLNQYPGLPEGVDIIFSDLPEDYGISFYPLTGSVIRAETWDILGGVHQQCEWPFEVVYRAAPRSEAERAGIKETLDNLGRWLEGQTITLDGDSYSLDSYPTISQDREITSFQRSCPGYLAENNEDGTQTWLIKISLKYDVDF